MIVTPDGGSAVLLGTTETAATIGITDYSRRETDAFGVTTVVERGFSRRMSVKLGVPFEEADALQRQLAELRATPALWVADDRYDSLSIRGFYKDFSLDLAVPPLSYCTLTVEGLTETGTFDDPGGDPASEGQASTLQLLQPLAMTDAILTASSVAEDEYPAWAAGTTYPDGARVVAAHRTFESLSAGNIGNVPADSPATWLDLGPTNRWAMFDQALGTATTAASGIALTLTPDADVTGLALLDVTQGVVRVQAAGYDRTQGSEPGKAVTFLDLSVGAGEAITVTLSHDTFEEALVWDDDAAWSDTAAWADTVTVGGGAGPVAVGTFLLGSVVGLGVTEASPTASITDYSRKETDEFGEASVVERAWAKRMSVNALLRSDAVDLVAGRLETVRARPSLWIGDVGLDSLTIYGFFKDFSIEVGESVSKLALSVEGLSKAAPIVTATSSYVPRGEYDPTAIYYTNSVVQFQGSSWLYIAVASSSGNAPPTLPTITNAWWTVFAQAGLNGENAPLVAIQWSVDGLTGWHADYADGDLYQRQSNDGGATYGPAVRVVGESASSGADGVSPSIVFKRSPTVPATPGTGTGNPPPGWSDGPPAGTDYLWQSVSRFRGAAQLQPWSAPVRISGDSAETYTVSSAGLGASLPPGFLHGLRDRSGAPLVDPDNGSDSALLARSYTVAYRPPASGWKVRHFDVNGGGALHYPGNAATDYANSARGMEELLNSLGDGTVVVVTTYDEPLRNRLSGVLSAALYACGASPDVFGGERTIWYDRGAYVLIGVKGWAAGRGYERYAGAVYSDPKAYVQTGFQIINGLPIAAYDGSAGLDGTNGLPGANGRTVHIAYADSADGSVNFTTGAAGGRTFIGVYTDTNPGVDSVNPASYGWTRLRGLDGTNGLPGPGGYVHIAYANSADGSVGFHLSDPTGRTYIGVYTDQSEPDSASPASYAWSLIKGEAGTSPKVLSLSASAFVIGATYTGATKAGQVPKSAVASVKQGDVDITGASTFSATATSDGIDVSVSGSTITVSRADSAGFVDVTAVHAGATVDTKRIEVARQIDSPPAQTSSNGSTSAAAAVSGASYVDSNRTTSVVTLQASSGGQLIGTFAGEYAVTTTLTRSFTMAGKLQYRPTSGGGWSDFPAGEVLGSTASNDPVNGNTPGAISMSQTVTGLSALGFYDVAFIGRRQSGNQTAVDVFGTLTARQS